jgi:hypothetical protein
MKKFNTGFNNLPNNISVGGLPIYNDDLIQLETNSLLFGVPTLLKGFSVVLSGCLVDELNTSSKTLNLTEGYVLIDDIVYYIPALINQSYPFSIVAGTQTIDTRIFKNGESKDVSISYNYAIKTSFSFTDSSIISPFTQSYPSNLTSQEIYFDPFTAQRSTWVLNNMSKSLNELSFVSNYIFQITKTQTGKNIVGGALQLQELNFSVLKWKWFGYTQISNTAYLRNETNTTTTIGGRTSLTLSKNNIPAHLHNEGTLITDNRLGDLATPQNIVDTDRGGAPSLWSVDNTSIYSLAHNHTITGNTGDGTADGLKTSPTAIALDPLYYSTYFLQYKGFSTYANDLRYGYKFWTDAFRPPYENM